MKENWIFPCNPKYFDIDNHFSSNEIVCFKKKGSPHVGDIVYIYISGTEKRLKYKCEIINEDVKDDLLKDHSYVIVKNSPSFVSPHYVAMKLLYKLESNEMNLDWLRQNGTVQFISPARICRETLFAIKKIDK